MRPLVEAVVADETGTMKATFFNQPWLERKYRPGTRLLLQGKYEARNRFRVQFHAPTGEAVGAAGSEVATYPATDGLSSTQILALVREWRGAAQEALEPLPARLRARDGLPDRPAALDAAHFGDHEGGRHRLAYDELLLLQIALLRRRARRREGSRATAARAARRADRPLAGRVAAVRADRRPAQGDGGGRRRAHARPADAAAADGRGRLRQDRRGGVRDAARRSSPAPRPR